MFCGGWDGVGKREEDSGEGEGEEGWMNEIAGWLRAVYCRIDTVIGQKSEFYTKTCTF